MVSADKVQKGIMLFITNELLPKAPGRDMWILSGAVAAYKPKINAIMMSMADANGNIDINEVIESVKPAAKQSPAKFCVPFGGEYTLTEADLDKLKNYISQA